MQNEIKNEKSKEKTDLELMPPPAPKRTSDLIPPPPSSSSLDLFPSTSSIQRVSDRGIPRIKKPLEPGHSPMDWAKLKASGANLTGKLQIERYTLDDVKKHNTKDDAWMIFNGKVYNITPYLPFHPGGIPQLMRGAGTDGTTLVMKYHPWVNVEMMLDKCMLGYFISGL